MPSIDIRRPHQLPLPEAREVVEKIAGRMREKLGVESAWEGDILHFNRSGVKGTIAVAADEVHVQAELGMMLAAFKPMVEQEIQRKLDQHLG